MQWRDEAIVLSTHAHGESALIVQALTLEHGRHAGLVRGGLSPHRRPVYQIGNHLLLDWKARLAEHLGTLTGELKAAHAARFMDDRARLAALASCVALLDATLPEREPHPIAFAGMIELLGSLDRDRGWTRRLVLLERDLLAELGFGIDLASCAATGVTEDLTYVSPRSGQAVSAAAAAPFCDRLLRLPPFLLTAAAPASLDDVLDGLALTGFFLEARVFAPAGRHLPAARSRFVDVLRQIGKVPP